MAQRTKIFESYNPNFKPTQQALIRDLVFYSQDITELFGDIDDIQRTIDSLSINVTNLSGVFGNIFYVPLGEFDIVPYNRENVVTQMRVDGIFQIDGILTLL